MTKIKEDQNSSTDEEESVSLESLHESSKEIEKETTMQFMKTPLFKSNKLIKQKAYESSIVVTDSPLKKASFDVEKALTNEIQSVLKQFLKFK